MVQAWHFLLCAVAVVNVAAWSLAATVLTRRRGVEFPDLFKARRLQLWLSAAYVFGCAFRSVLPVYDIPRIVVVDSWLSTVAIGRSVATLAELAFAAQWALLLRECARDTKDRFAERVSWVIVPFIALAEVCSWHAVLTTSNLGHVAENSLWGVSGALVVAVLARGFLDGLSSQEALNRRAARKKGVRSILRLWCGAGVAYVAFIFIFDVPVYWQRWIADEAAGRQYLSLAEGLIDAATRTVVSHDWAVWSSEVVWMSLYFSGGVWISVSLVLLPRPWRVSETSGNRFLWVRSR